MYVYVPHCLVTKLYLRCKVVHIRMEAVPVLYTSFTEFLANIVAT